MYADKASLKTRLMLWRNSQTSPCMRTDGETSRTRSGGNIVSIGWSGMARLHLSSNGQITPELQPVPCKHTWEL